MLVFENMELDFPPTVSKFTTSIRVQITQLLFLSERGNKPKLAPYVLSWPEW